MIMPEKNASYIEYRGYTLVAIEQSPGWRIHIYPGHGLLRIHPDHVSALTKEDALAQARATVDYHMLG
jgi:hypothetical protein